MTTPLYDRDGGTCQRLDGRRRLPDPLKERPYDDPAL